MTPKKELSKDINKFRPIALLPAVYKIWATVLAKRFTPVTNLLANDLQIAYEINRTSNDLIFFTKNKIKNNKVQGQLLLGLSKAFDRVGRNKPWWILYKRVAINIHSNDNRFALSYNALL